jgi:hypothetical protein
MQIMTFSMMAGLEDGRFVHDSSGMYEESNLCRLEKLPEVG